MRPGCSPAACSTPSPHGWWTSSFLHLASPSSNCSCCAKVRQTPESAELQGGSWKVVPVLQLPLSLPLPEGSPTPALSQTPLDQAPPEEPQQCHSSLLGPRKGLSHCLFSQLMFYLSRPRTAACCDCGMLGRRHAGTAACWDGSLRQLPRTGLLDS